MTDSKHTPGPWTLKEANTTIPIIGVHGHTVASVRYGPTDYGDACLIAAAPDMHAALQFALTDHGAVGYTRTMKEARQRLDAITAIARAALAKAEGR